MAARWPRSPRVVTLSALRDANGVLLDRALVTRFDAPDSYTGDDMAELTTHGGLVVPATVIASVLERGARLALPGEFTRRAFLNGKLDLLQAEATGDLVAATSRAAQRAALAQLDGGLTRRVAALRHDLLGLEALLAYDIDFPEEDDGPVPPGQIARSIETVLAGLTSLASTAAAGELVREGALVVLAGAPNAGKSSLFNALLGQRRAIVTDIPGTTRDALEAVIDAGRWPLRLVDTAGLREAGDRVEQLGVGVAREYIERAMIVLACADTPDDLRATAAAIRATTSAPLILVVTKADLGGFDPATVGSDATIAGPAGVVVTSAETGAGLGTLIDLVSDVLDRTAGEVNGDTPILSRARHRHIVGAALDEVRAFQRALDERSVPISVAAVHLRAAVLGLEDLIGRVDVEQILDEVFSRFCVGK